MSTFAMRPFLVGVAVALLFGASVWADAPAGLYTIAAGTVHDTKTKLVWQQSAPATLFTWADGKSYCASANVSATLGGTGWRLPTIKELQTIVDDSRASSPIDPNAFPAAPTTFFWSSTPAAGMAGFAWGVYFMNGTTGPTATTGPGNVRCVR